MLVYCYPRLSIRMESIWCISYDHRISYDVYVYSHRSQKCVWVPTVPGKREKSRNSKKKRFPGLGKVLKLGKYWALEKYGKKKHITSIHLQKQVRLDNICHKIAFSQLKQTYIQKQCKTMCSDTLPAILKELGKTMGIEQHLNTLTCNSSRKCGMANNLATLSP